MASAITGGSGGPPGRHRSKTELRHEFPRLRHQHFDLDVRYGSRRGLTLEIDYVEARTDAGMAKIAKFLKINPRGLGAPRTAKRNSDNIASRFQNKDEVLPICANDLERWAKEH